MTSDSLSIVVVEDDQSVREMLASILSTEGYRVTVYQSAEDALSDTEIHSAHLAILDIGLPGGDGLDLCRRIRMRGNRVSILMLTARHQIADRVAGLDAGADDYLVKPFALDELLARVRALIRRSADASPTTATLTLGDLVIDPDTHTVTRGERPIELTHHEFELLALLVAQSPKVVTRQQLHEHVWGHDEYMSNSLEVFISQIRKKIEAASEPRLIHTVRSVGYVARTK